MHWPVHGMEGASFYLAEEAGTMFDHWPARRADMGSDVVSELDTATDAWTVASGNYSSRFSGVGAGAVLRAAEKVARKLQAIAAGQLGCEPHQVELRDAKAWQGGEAVSVRRLAGIAHWHPDALPEGVEPGLHETAYYAAPNLAPPDEDDRVVSSAAHGFLVDVAVVEVERTTGAVQVRDYVSVHDYVQVHVHGNGIVSGGLFCWDSLGVPGDAHV